MTLFDNLDFIKANILLLLIFLKHALVVRDGQKLTVNAQDLVIGDIVLVRAGDRVPADIRVLESQGFKVSTGVLLIIFNKYL